MTTEVLELYKIYARDPDRFLVVMENIYLKFLLDTKGDAERAVAFIEKEDMEDSSRDEFIVEEVNYVSRLCQDVIAFSKNFYRMRVCHSSAVTGEDVISFFSDIANALDTKTKELHRARYDDKDDAGRLEKIQVDILDIFGETISNLDSSLDDFKEILDSFISI